MIRGFAEAETATVWSGRRGRKLPSDIQGVALRKLRMLNQARSLRDLLVPPANLLEALKGDRKGQHSIRVNDQWRVVFEWTAQGPSRVKVTDYHEWQEDGRMKIHRQPTTPGEILSEEFLKPMGMTQTELADHIGCDVKVVNRIVNGRTSVTAEMAIRLGAALRMSPEFWLNAQQAVDIYHAARKVKKVPAPIRLAG